MPLGTRKKSPIKATSMCQSSLICGTPPIQRQHLSNKRKQKKMAENHRPNLGFERD
ncbi:unnamed protein product [Dovyalis caffra]|uniref:Uncharacterized protein n=1 Tax=Dovyalis caffra TaxID=77055 RepID=A0AAV1S954_9ROSI|nr:unnamed protein product [Dovyalis caffra]